MSVSARSLKRLVTLSEILRDRDLAALDGCNRRAKRIRDRVEELRCPPWQGVSGAIDPASLAGQHTRYQLWVMHELERLNGELAQVLAEREKLLGKARRSVGRLEALSQLSDEA